MTERNWSKTDASAIGNTYGHILTDAITEIQRLQADISKWKQLLADEQERNLNNVANADLQIAELQAEIAQANEMIAMQKALADEFAEKAQSEIARLRAGGCARDQGLTQYCAEMVAASNRIAELERHIWYDAYKAAKESGEFDDDAEIIANKAVEMTKEQS